MVFWLVALLLLMNPAPRGLLSGPGAERDTVPLTLSMADVSSITVSLPILGPRYHFEKHLAQFGPFRATLGLL